jgi:K+-sensing histidine kinase KdpD
MGNKSSAEKQSDFNVSWDNVVRFVRQLSHDLRNDLNAVELQAAFLGELAAENPELKEEVKRLREMMSKLTTTLQGLSTALAPVNPTTMPYQVSDFVEDFQQKLSQDFPTPAEAITWEVKTGGAKFEVDPQLLQHAFLEVFRNAFEHERGDRNISATAKIDNGKFVFILREPKAGFEKATDQWGRQPLGKVRQGHYGLGLNRVRVILEAHGGDLRAQYDAGSSELVTTIALPVS